MAFDKSILLVSLFINVAITLDGNNDTLLENNLSDSIEIDKVEEENAAEVFNGVYTECFIYLSYSCLQRKTLLYLQELEKLSEVSVIGDYVKFVKINDSTEDVGVVPVASEDLSSEIDSAVDKFFNNHILKFSALGEDIAVPRSVEEFVGRKRKGGGGGGGHGGGDDGGKKKMMMMAMMCMKMKLMMMVPAMMGMMGMMSFKGMMFSMMSFMMSKMMLLMKLLEKKGGGGGGDGGWAAGGGGGGAWMPAGGQDYGGGGGGGGGYDANGQWQSRSIFTPELAAVYPEIAEEINNKPIISYVKPVIRYNNGKKPFTILKNLNAAGYKTDKDEIKSRRKRGIVDVLQNAYMYWINQMLSIGSKKYYPVPKIPKYKVHNGMKYVFYPMRMPKLKPMPVAEPIRPSEAESEASFKPIVTAEDFNKGEIVEGAVESRMTKKLNNFKNDVNIAIEENPWQ